MSELFWKAADFVKVWDSEVTSIHRLKYFAERPCASGREFFSGQAFFFYEEGFFELELQNQSHLIDPTCLVFNHHGDEWAVSLPAKTKILCTEIVLKDPLLRELISETEQKSPQNIEHGQLSLENRTNTTAEINGLHRQLLIELGRRSIGSGLLIDSIATTLCVLALRRFTAVPISQTSNGLSKKNGNLEIEKIELAKLYLSKRLREEVSLHELAQRADVSPYHFIRMFKRLTAQTPHQYITNLKVSYAKSLLTETAEGITEIAFQLGYSNPSHFSALFKRSVGLTPQAFRKSIGR